MVKYDQATLKWEKLQYARVLLEVQIDQALPDDISFINERDQITKVKVEYEWKPIICKSCNGMGHNTNECRKTVIRQEWRQKEDIVAVEQQKDSHRKIMEPEFQKVRNPARRLIIYPVPVGTQNEFDPLKVPVNEVVVGQIQCKNVNDFESGGGQPPNING